MLLEKATNGNGIVQEKMFTVSIYKSSVEEARTYFIRVEAELATHFAGLGSRCFALNTIERLRILHDFYRPNDESHFHFDMSDMARKGHDFKDYICPDYIERSSDYVKLGEKYCRILFFKDYASYIKDKMVTDMTNLSHNMMLSIDILSVPTDKTVGEVERKLLSVETNITNRQRRQNANNNFSAVIPYDMELQRKKNINVLDKAGLLDEKMKNSYIPSRDFVRKQTEKDEEKPEDKLQNASSDIANKSVNVAYQSGKRLLIRSKQKFIKQRPENSKKCTKCNRTRSKTCQKTIYKTHTNAL